MYKLWKVSESGELVLDFIEIKLFKEFQNLWIRRLHIVGDADGRDKKFNKAAFKFLWFFCDMRSPYFEEPLDLKVHKSIKASGLDCAFEKGYDWEKIPGEKIWKELKKLVPELDVAVKKYSEVQDSYDVKILRGIKQGLQSGNLLVDIANKRIGKAVAHLETLEEQGLEEDDESDKKLAKALKALEDIVKFSKEIPDAIERIEAFEDRVKAKLSKKNIGQGGKKIGNRATPKGNKVD